MSYIDHTDVESWTVEDLVNSIQKNPVKKRVIDVPKYQRSLVWSDDQKEMLIKSIKSGFPIGSLLLYKSEPDKEGNTVYLLIDGLQRSSTLLDYITRPTQFYTKADVPDDLISTISGYVRFENPEKEYQLPSIIVDWIKSLKGFEEASGFSSYNLANAIDDRFELELDKKVVRELVNLLTPFVDTIKRESNIGNVKIPVIVYTGSVSNLPLIFERLNSKGTQLNKYQIYAATWTAFPSITIKDTKIIDYIKEKYEDLIEEGFHINNFDPDSFYTSDFSVFEYMFGLGKMLSKKHPHFFGLVKEGAQNESVAFNLVCLCLDIDLKDMSKIPERLLRIEDKGLFQSALEESINFVFQVLKPFISLKANKKSVSSSKLSVYHTEYQICSIIGKVFRVRYDAIFNERDNWSDNSKILAENIPYHYLYEILKEFWRGTGDAKAMQAVSSDRYMSSIYEENWDNVLNEWFDYEIQKKERQRVSIKDNVILFLKYIYTHLLTAHEELSSKRFEIEHLVPVARLKGISGESGLPMSAISNLCLIERSLNQDKRDMTFYEYIEHLTSKGEITEDQAKEKTIEIEKYTFTKKNELDFVVDAQKFNEEAYNLFLIERFDTLKKVFYALNKIQQKPKPPIIDKAQV